MTRFILSKRVGTFKDKIKQMSTEVLDLIAQLELATMSYFIDGLHNAFWCPHYDMLKLVDAIAKCNGHVARHVALCCFIICQDVELLQNTVESNEFFASFSKRRQSHVNEKESERLIYECLPPLVFGEIKSTFEKHFRQWLTNKSLWCVLAAEQQTSQLLTQFTFNLPILNAPFQLNFFDRAINPMELNNFLIKCSYLAAMKEHKKFKEHDHALAKTST